MTLECAKKTQNPKTPKPHAICKLEGRCRLQIYIVIAIEEYYPKRTKISSFSLQLSNAATVYLITEGEEIVRLYALVRLASPKALKLLVSLSFNCYLSLIVSF